MMSVGDRSRCYTGNNQIRDRFRGGGPERPPSDGFHLMQTEPSYSEVPPSAPEKVPLARTKPWAPTSLPVPPTMVCRSTMDPSGVVVNTPAFLMIRAPCLPLTAPVMVESDVNANTEVVGVSAVGVMALAVPLNDPEMSPL